MLDLQIGALHVDTYLKTAKFKSELAGADAALSRAATTMAATAKRINLAFGGMSAGNRAIQGLSTRIGALNVRLRATAALANAAARAIRGLNALQGGGGSAFKGLGAGLGLMFRGIGQGMGPALKGLGIGISSVITGVGKSGGSLAQGLGMGLSSVAKGLGTGLSSAFRGAAPLVKGLGMGLGSASRGLGGGLSSVLGGFGKGVGNITKGLGGGFGQATKGLGSGLSNVLKGTSSLVRGIGGAFSQVTRAFGSSLSGVLRAAVAPFSGLAGGLGGMLSIGGLGAIGGGLSFGLVVKQAADIESSMANLGRITALDGEKLTTVGEKIKGIATTMNGVKLEGLFGIASMGAKQGIGGAGLATFTRDIAKFGMAIDDIPIEEATTGISRLLNIFGKGPGDALRFGSALVKLDQASTATARDILDITTRIAPMGRILGIQVPELMALSAALKDTGINSEVAGSSMTQLFRKMSSPKEMGAFAKIVGMTTESWKSMVASSPMNALKTFAAAIGKMDEFAAIGALDSLKLKGQGASQTILGLASVLPKLEQFTRDANAEMRHMGAIEDAAAAKSKTLWAILDRVNNTVKLLAAKIGEFLLPIVKAAADAFSELALDVTTALGRNGGAIKGWADGVAKTVRFVGLLWQEWPTVIALAWEMGVEKLEQGFAIVSRFAGQVWANITTGASNAATVLKNAFTGLGTFLGDLFGQIGLNLKDNIFNAIAGIGAQMPPLAKKALLAWKPELAPILNMQQVVPHKIVADPGLVGDIFKGMRAMPGIDGGAIFNNLPNRAGVIGGLQGELGDKRRARDDKAAADKERADKEAAGERERGDTKALDAKKLAERATFDLARRGVEMMPAGRARKQAEIALGLQFPDQDTTKLRTQREARQADWAEFHAKQEVKNLLGGGQRDPWRIGRDKKGNQWFNDRAVGPNAANAGMRQFMDKAAAGAARDKLEKDKAADETAANTGPNGAIVIALNGVSRSLRGGMRWQA